MLKKSIDLPCSLGSMVKLVAKIGGHLGRSGDPPPGHQVMWNGYAQLQLMCEGFLIAGRMVHPGSERETVRWLSETSGVGELLGAEVELYDNALRRTAVLLWENHAAIEQELSDREREIFSLKETVILYDLTNTYFEGSKRGSKIVRHGKSKERRNVCPTKDIVSASLRKGSWHE